MATDEPLRAWLEEQLAPLGAVVVKRMFGGAGVFVDGLMIGLVADSVLYLKTDDASRLDFEREGLAPFTYRRKGGRATVMSYSRAPERLLDDPDEMLAWASRAREVARRTASRKASRAAVGRRRP
jgi:DNA transformation protein